MNKDKVTCAVCGKKFGTITWNHLKTHGLTFTEYKLKYPNVKTTSDEVKNKKSGQNGSNWKGGKVKLVCQCCGKHINVPKCKVNIRRFCSRKCMGIYNSKHRIGDNSNRWIKNKPTIVCEKCGIKIEVIPSQAKTRRFCSKKCESEFNVGENNPFYGKHHTLESKKMMQKNRVILKQEDNPLWIERTTKNCEMCGCEYEVERRLVNRSHFCSKQCRANHDSINSKGLNNPNWKGGITKDRQVFYSSRKWRKIVKDVFKRDNYQCQRCGIVGKQENKLHIHHIISFKNVNKRDDIGNLILLCQKCHNWVHSKKNIDGDFQDEKDNC